MPNSNIQYPPLDKLDLEGTKQNGGPSPAHEATNSTQFRLENHPIDEVQKLKVAIIGAGLCGITAGILLPRKVPGIQLKIIEKNDDVSGTWFENTYPGVRCDIPAHVYQSTFAPNTQWTEEFAQGAEIRDYWRGVAQKFDVYQYIDFHRQVLTETWDSNLSQWTLEIQDLGSRQKHTESFDVVINALGNFNAWKIPDFPGLEDYKGHVCHSSHWDSSNDAKGKSVAIIGNGASGLQVLPEIQKLARHVDHYCRSKTWIASSFAGDERTVEAKPYSEEQRESFRDPQTYLEFRRGMEDKYFRNIAGWLHGSAQNNENRKAFTKLMLQRVAKKPELAKDLIPDFSPSCRRLTPGPGYLEALCEENVDVIRTPISCFTATGIKTVDGIHRAVDQVICCTGANTDFVPVIPIIAHGTTIQDLWHRDGNPGYPYTYFGFATPGFPNLLFLHGPHGAGLSGTVPSSAETAVTYMARLLRKVSRQGIKTFEPSKEATDEWQEYSDAFFERTVLKEKCKSWANGGAEGGRVHGFWPGSGRHVISARADPRWEDWNWTFLGSSGNRFAYLGNGSTVRELDPNGNVTSYLKPEPLVDLRSYHENWWEV